MTETTLLTNIPPAESPVTFPGSGAEILGGYYMLERERAIRELEAKLPGLPRVFEGMIERLYDLGISHGNIPGEFPVVASIVRKNTDGRLEVVSSHTNRVNQLQDSTAHAEMEAIKEAENKLGDKHLTDCWLLSTLEPCATMCTGAVINTKLDGVVYGLSHADVVGKHAQVNGEYKAWRTNPEEVTSAGIILPKLGIQVVSGYKVEEIRNALGRVHGSWDGYYRDPDA